MDSRPIGIFDSGAGGLTVLHECLVTLPHEDFLYLGDGARCPYGPRPRDEIGRFAHEIASYLEDAGVKLIVAACNSATAAALPQLQEKLQVPVIGVLAPEAHAAVQATRNRRIGVLATEATVASGAYEDALAEASRDARLYPVACPELAPLIQAGGEVDDRVVAQVEAYCDPLRDADVDTVILGCTHYPLVRPMLQRSLGRAVKVVSSGQAIADEVEVALRQRGLERPEDRRGEYRFLCSADPESFRAVGTRFLQLPMGEVRHVDVSPAPKAAAA